MGRADCDGDGECECEPEPVPIAVLRVFAMAVDEDALYAVATVDSDDLPLLRRAHDGEGRTEEIGPPIPALTSGAVIDGVPYASTDRGDVVRVDRDGLTVLAERQFEIVGVELAADGVALWWLDERGELYRLDPNAPGAVRMAPSPPSLVAARPYDLQVDVLGFAWRAELDAGLASDDVVVTGASPGGPGMRARPGSVVDAVAITLTHICHASFDEVFCLPR